MDIQHELELANARIISLESQLAVLTEKANTVQERFIQRLEALHDLDRVLLSADSLENLAELALRHVVKLIPCTRASIATIDVNAGTGLILALYSEQPTALIAQQNYPIHPGFLAPITSEPYFVINHLDQHESHEMQQLYSEGIRTILVVPLRTEENLAGLLNLHSHQPDYFSAENIEIALEVAAQLAIGVHKAALNDALARYAERMEILHAIDLGLIQGGSIKKLIATTVQQLRRMIACDRVGVGVIQADQVVIFTTNFDAESELSEGIRIPIPPRWFDSFDADGIRVFNNLHLLDNDPTFQRLIKEGYQSQLQVLLQSELGKLGIMGFSSKALNFFTEEHQGIAKEVSSHLAIALHQVALNEALERYAAEMEQRVMDRTTELQASKDQIEAILHNSLDGILLIDRDLKIQQANPAVSRLLAFELNTHATVNLLDLIHPEDASNVRASIEAAIVNQMPTLIEVRGRQQNAVHMEFNVGYIPGDGLVSTIHDITTRKQAEEALKEALAKEKELLEAKSRFVSVASHEFRTPLTSILANADMLLHYRERLAPAEIERKLTRISENVLRMRAMMDNTLQMSKIQAGRFEYEPVMSDLDALCREVITEFESHPGNQNRLLYTSPATPMLAIFDIRLMWQVVNNLISNALKYSPADKVVRLSLSQEDAAVVLRISDQGIGIPDEDLRHLFEPFHRGTNVRTISGTGLGLSITKQIIEVHGGTIKVESQVGQGTTFTVALMQTKNLANYAKKL